jgi:hypothetical protein
MPTLDRKDSNTKTMLQEQWSLGFVCRPKLAIDAYSAPRRNNNFDIGLLTLRPAWSHRSGRHEPVQSLSFDISFLWVVQSSLLKPNSHDLRSRVSNLLWQLWSSRCSKNHAYRAIVINHNRRLATCTQTHCCHLTGVDVRSQSSQHAPLRNRIVSKRG